MGDVLNAAAFWGSIAQLLGIGAAWLAFVSERHDARKRTFEAERSTLAGIEAEMRLISPWASGDPPENPGYPPGSPESYKDEKWADWSNPFRIIFRLECPVIRNLTRSPHARRFES